MDNFIFSNYSASERARMLRDNCDAIEEKRYPKRLKEEEILLRREEVANLSIEIHELEQSKKESAAEYAAQIKPKKLMVAEALDALKSQSISVVEEVFKIVDHDKGMVGYYNSEGELVESRRMLPNERQFTLKSASGE